MIINLQKTPRDQWANMVIHDYVDNVMKSLTQLLGIAIPPPSKLPLEHLSNTFCHYRPSDWLYEQLKDETESSSSEEESDSATPLTPVKLELKEKKEREEESDDESLLPTEADPEWDPQPKSGKRELTKTELSLFGLPGSKRHCTRARTKTE